MPTRIALKDVVLLLAVLAVGALVLISMRQEDRRFLQQRELINRVESLERAGPAFASPTTADAPSPAAPWARPGVPIVTGIQPNPEWMRVNPRAALGGTLVEALESSPQTLTPLFATDAQARRVILDTVTQTLAGVPAKYPEPRDALLASAWQIDPGRLWLRVRLDDRARFSDGSPVTAEDVKFSLDILRTPGLDAERTRDTLSAIDSIEVISERVAEFHFKEARPLNVLHALCSLNIVPKHFYDRFTPDQLNQSTGLLMGSGPFMLPSVDVEHQWKPGSDIVLVRNPFAWRASPALDAIRFVIITDAAARLTAATNGDVHIIRPTPDQLAPFVDDDYANDPVGALVDWDIGSSFSAIAWNCGTRGAQPALTSDRAVRTALTMLVDRARIAEEFYKGLATVAVGPFPKNSWMNDPAVEPMPFDPAHAASLLDEAGWTTRNAEGVRTNAQGRALDIELAIPQGSRLAEFVALMLKDEAAKVGVRIRITTADMAAIAAMERAGDFDGAVVAWSHGLPENEPRQSWHSSSISDGDNFCHFSNPMADKIIELGEQALDTNARMELWHRLHRMLHDDQPCTFLVNPAWVRLVSPRVASAPRDFYGFDYAGVALTPETSESSK